MTDFSSTKIDKESNEKLESQTKLDIDTSVSRVFKLKEKIPEIWENNSKDKSKSMGRFLESFYIFQDGLELIEPHPERLEKHALKKLQKRSSLIGDPIVMYSWIREIYNNICIGISTEYIDSAMKEKVFKEISSVIELLNVFRNEEKNIISNDVLSISQEKYHEPFIQLVDMDSALIEFINKLSPNEVKIEQAKQMEPILRKVGNDFVSWFNGKDISLEEDIYNNKFLSQDFNVKVLNLELLKTRCFNEKIEPPKPSEMFFERIKSNFRLALAFLARIEIEIARDNVKKRVEIEKLSSISLKTDSYAVGKTIDINSIIEGKPIQLLLSDQKDLYVFLNKIVGGSNIKLYRDPIQNDLGNILFIVAYDFNEEQKKQGNVIRVVLFSKGDNSGFIPHYFYETADGHLGEEINMENILERKKQKIESMKGIFPNGIPKPEKRKLE